MRYDLTRSRFNRLVRAYRPSRYETFGEQSGLRRLPDCRQTARQSAIDWAKVPLYLVPYLRGSLLILWRKP